MATRTTLLRTVALCAALGLAATACGDDDDTDVVDLAAQAESVDRPDWLPPEWDPPEGARLIEVIDDPADDFEPSATYVVDRDFDEVLADVQRILDTLRWTPRDIADPRFGLDEGGSSHQYFYLDNGRVQSIRVYSDPNLSGTRVTVEAPAGTNAAPTDESTPDDGTPTTVGDDDGAPSSTTTTSG
ncbi:MAG: hypothetical protein S0880_32645 [Actinomycetota bacterium]|nr:hypothetical protein [Actinomycetota bacterium]